MFGQEDPLGKTIGSADDQRKIIGVVDYFRHKSSFQSDDNVLFQPMSKWETDVLLRVAPGAGAAFEARLAEIMHRIGKDWNIEIQHVTDMRANQDKLVLAPILILFIICGFLVFNVALGLFGVLFQNINRRKGEIGLRRAIGATQKQVMQYFISETLVIAGFGLLLGVFFAVQIPLLNVFDVAASTYLWAIVLAVASIVLIAVICALYPSRQAAVILPAAALHEE
jgi:putative ABC transport system permease protein